MKKQGSEAVLHMSGEKENVIKISKDMGRERLATLEEGDVMRSHGWGGVVA